MRDTVNKLATRIETNWLGIINALSQPILEIQAKAHLRSEPRMHNLTKRILGDVKPLLNRLKELYDEIDINRTEVLYTVGGWQFHLAVGVGDNGNYQLRELRVTKLTPEAYPSVWTHTLWVVFDDRGVEYTKYIVWPHR